MKCPKCGERIGVEDSRSARSRTTTGRGEERIERIEEAVGQAWTMRRRKCKSCGHQMHTVEVDLKALEMLVSMRPQPVRDLTADAFDAAVAAEGVGPDELGSARRGVPDA